MSDITRVKQEILATIRRKRAEITPEILARAQQAARHQHNNTVPYDKKAASDTIKMFLKNHKNAEEFERRLIRKLENQT